MKTQKLIILVLIVAFFASCGGSGKVNVKQTQKPTMLVIPSDQLLKQKGALREEKALGKTLQVRDYNDYFLKDTESKFIISTIQSEFIAFGYPLNDLEQTLKSLNDQGLLDEADGVKKDAKTILVTSAKPDIILEIDYDARIDNSTRNYRKTLTYTLRAIDAFTNKVVATAQQTGVSDKKENSAAALMKIALEKDAKEFTKQVDNYFDDIIANGRDITVRIVIDKGESFVMSDESIYGETYADYLIDYMKANTVQGSYNMQRNTDSELYFTNVRIKTLNENGTQYSAYDFARELSRTLNKECGVKSKNITQGLGDAEILIKGM